MRSMKYLVASVVMAMPLAVTAASEDSTNATGKPRGAPANKLYIVRMADNPVVAYDGTVPGYAATKPRKGQKIDPNDNKVVRYAGYLDSRHDGAVAAVGGRKVYSYHYAFNGFAAELTDAQVTKILQQPGVIAAQKDEAYKRDTSTTPGFLGLSGPSGFWSTKAKGENVIIGMVDTGIWPEHPSFSDRTGTNGNGTQGDKLDYQQIPGWHGKCVPGAAFNASNCNQKLIGAQFYNAGWGGDAGVMSLFPYEYLSPRDADGHGTHTSSTAGGNNGVMPDGAAAAFGAISGIAPRARISTYKVCWGRGEEGGCFGSDSVAAIDQAVADGVDVINFSVGGSQTNFRDAVEIAFLFAADAGVFVATSAGNDGPTTSTVAHPGPWVTTVAAGTHNRDGVGSVTLGSGATINGASVATPVAARPLIDSTAAGLAGKDATEVRLCFIGTLDPAKVAGKVVACDRGVNGRVEKSLAVQMAGGAGMVLMNTSANSLNADFHYVPTVHVSHLDRAAVKAHAASAGGTAAIGPSTIVLTAAAPFTASFSSRGPLRASGSLLKPDIIAPGQDILAGISPAGDGGRLFDLLSGTSMSSPHIAGIAALFKELHPDWSPMAIKSALMTTAGDILDGPNTNPLVIFRQGAGHVRPNNAADPGLVFDAAFNDWMNFICGVQPGSFCSSFTAVNPSDHNVASIALGAMTGTQTITRKVTNVGSQSETYTASVTGLSGITTVLPGAMTIAKGATQSFNVGFTRTTAALNGYTGGQLTLTGDKGHVVRIPVVVRPVALSAPVQVGGTYSVTFGYTGPFSATARGLIPATITSGTVTQDPDQTFDPAVTTGTVSLPVTIPAGTTYARLALFDADVSAGSDLDVYVYQGTTLVGASTNGGTNEEVNFVFSPPLGADTPLTVYIHGWGVTGGSSPFKLHAWNLGSADAGNMTVGAPASATLGGTGTITLGFSGLTAGQKYLGSVVYGGATGLPSPTIVRVDP